MDGPCRPPCRTVPSALAAAFGIFFQLLLYIICKQPSVMTQSRMSCRGRLSMLNAPWGEGGGGYSTLYLGVLCGPPRRTLWKAGVHFRDMSPIDVAHLIFNAFRLMALYDSISVVMFSLAWFSWKPEEVLPTTNAQVFSTKFLLHTRKLARF